jgi:hypothetical protein
VVFELSSEKKPSLSFFSLTDADKLEEDMGGFREGKIKSANEESLEDVREDSRSEGNSSLELAREYDAWMKDEAEVLSDLMGEIRMLPVGDVSFTSIGWCDDSFARGVEGMGCASKDPSDEVRSTLERVDVE